MLALWSLYFYIDAQMHCMLHYTRVALGNGYYGRCKCKAKLYLYSRVCSCPTQVATPSPFPVVSTTLGQCIQTRHIKGAGWSIGHNVTERLRLETKELARMKEDWTRDNSGTEEGTGLWAAEAGGL